MAVRRVHVGAITAVVSLIACATFIPASGAAERETLKLLEERLWTKRDAYDAAHILMVPMHAAYKAADQKAIRSYRSFVSRFLDDGHREDLGRLTELQFSYFLSRFLVLESREGTCSDISHRAATHIAQVVVEILNEPAWLWNTPDFPNMFDRIVWKLSDKTPPVQGSGRDRPKPGYLKAIFDEDLFSLAIAADLTVAMPVCRLEVPTSVSRAAGLGYRVIAEGGRMVDDKWTFQPGVWRDHPDYVYAGNRDLAPELQKKPVDGIGWDSSHSHRFPLWLRSFRCAASAESQEREKIDTIIAGFTNQFLQKVFAPDPTFGGAKLRNFVTGHNGIYRYSYPTVGPGGGYGPFGLSSTFNLGWWSFLGTEMLPLYREQINQLPFPQPVIDLYMQPVVTVETAPRARHPSFDTGKFLRGELIQEILSAAKELAERGADCP